MLYIFLLKNLLLIPNRQCYFEISHVYFLFLKFISILVKQPLTFIVITSSIIYIYNVTFLF